MFSNLDIVYYRSRIYSDLVSMYYQRLITLSLLQRILLLSPIMQPRLPPSILYLHAPDLYPGLFFKYVVPLASSPVLHVLGYVSVTGWLLLYCKTDASILQGNRA